MNADAFPAIAAYVLSCLSEVDEFRVQANEIEELFELDPQEPWFRDFEKWLSDLGQPFLVETGWKSSVTGNPSGPIGFARGSHGS